MRLVVQRVRSAWVQVDGQEQARIGAGAMVLVGVARQDTEADAAYLARKTATLRIFDDEQGRMDLDPAAVDGAFLVVSQFTLYGDCRKGNRPSYIEAAGPEEGERLYRHYVDNLRGFGRRVETGIFRAQMTVGIENDGPVTLILESRGRARP